jgi:hypothetical protein
MFSSSSFTILVLRWGLWSFWNWFLHRVRNEDLFSVFYVWISNFPNTICWRGCLFSSVCFWQLLENQMAIAAWVYFWILYCIPLVYVSVFGSVQFCLCFERGSHYVPQAGLEFVILLPQPCKSWNYRFGLLHPAPCWFCNYGSVI